VTVLQKIRGRGLSGAAELRGASFVTSTEQRRRPSCSQHFVEQNPNIKSHFGRSRESLILCDLRTREAVSRNFINAFLLLLRSLFGELLTLRTQPNACYSHLLDSDHFELNIIRTAHGRSAIEQEPCATLCTAREAYHHLST
jgi:hypothetical protein